MLRRAVLIALAATLLIAPLPAAAAPGPPPYTETPVTADAHVSESYVSLYAPLPAADGPHPAACDRLAYLRFRDTHGPQDPARADAVLISQPGIFESAGAFDQVARNTVRAAAARGYRVEFWALNRRSNCLEDTFGVQAGIAARSPQPALDYYYGGKTVEGHEFPGFVSEQQAAWLSHVGLAQTVQDEYTVISQLPPRVRRTKVFCGGHSLGGILTAAFANWDFSGTGDAARAGYNQCAGYFALDTRLSISLGAQMAAQSLGGGVSSLQSPAASPTPYINSPPFTPEVFAALPILGLASYYQPDQLDHAVLAQLPNDFDFNLTYRLLFSSNYLSFLTGIPDIRQFNATNQAALAIVFDDNTEPIGILRASIGVPTGGPVIEKNFPVPYGSPPLLMGLLGGNKQVAPAIPNGPVYRWRNYDQVPTPGPSPVDDPGHPYTSAASEVSDVTQLSRALFAAPALFTEDYFPSALVSDLAAAAGGDHQGSLAGLRYTDGITRRPAAYIDAGEGVTPSLPPALGQVPSGPAPQVHVVAPGYNHLDVVTAAERQNNARPEITSSTLAGWMSRIVGR